jgi:hypothetical protein
VKTLESWMITRVHPGKGENATPSIWGVPFGRVKQVELVEGKEVAKGVFVAKGEATSISGPLKSDWAVALDASRAPALPIEIVRTPDGIALADAQVAAARAQQPPFDNTRKAVVGLRRKLRTAALKAEEAKAKAAAEAAAAKEGGEKDKAPAKK